jgi:hypothetical protein
MNNYLKNFIHLSALTIAIVSGITNAQTAPESNWIQVYVTESLTISVDKASLKRNGDIVAAWEAIIDKKERKSFKTLTEYNCKTNQRRALSMSGYQSLDFTGKSTTYSPQKDWSYVVRDTNGEDLIAFACKNAPKGFIDYLR